MKFARLGTPGAEIPVLVDGERYLDLRSVTSDVNGDFLAGDFRARIDAARAADELPVLEDAAAMRIGAPIARPSAVICIGQNLSLIHI